MARTRSLPTAARSGDRLRALETLRDLLARAIADCDSPRDVAPLARELRAALTEIAALTATSTVTREDQTLDEVAKRRADRGAGAPRGERPGGSDAG